MIYKDISELMGAIELFVIETNTYCDEDYIGTNFETHWMLTECGYPSRLSSYQIRRAIFSLVDGSGFLLNGDFRMGDDFLNNNSDWGMMTLWSKHLDL